MSARKRRALPAPVERFRDLALRGMTDPVETAVIDTSAWMRRPGMPPLPLRVVMYHRAGHEFMHDIRIGRGRLSLRLGLDAYVDGRGLMKVGRSVQTGVQFDQGALIALWSEVLCFPSAWQDRTDVAWEGIDDHAARLLVDGPEGTIPITVAFDPITGLPAVNKAKRYKSTGPLVRWSGASSEWRRFSDGVLVPGRFQAQWADEPRPWIDLRTKSVAINVPVDDRLAVARRVLAERSPTAKEPT